MRNIKGNDAIDLIHLSEVRRNNKVDYTNIFCDHRLLKAKKYRVRLIIGGDVLSYLGDVSLPTDSLLEAKLLMNSVILGSHRGAQFMSLDIKNYFLQTVLNDP